MGLFGKKSNIRELGEKAILFQDGEEKEISVAAGFSGYRSGLYRYSGCILRVDSKYHVFYRLK